MSKLQRQWDALREEGDGYSIGVGDDTDVLGSADAVEAAIEAEGWVLISSMDGDDVAIARKPDGTTVGVGWVYGPWAIDLDPDRTVREV